MLIKLNALNFQFIVQIMLPNIKIEVLKSILKFGKHNLDYK